jgi:hypothetical protein
MSTSPSPAPWATAAQVVGIIVMTLASVYWAAVDYPDWLPAPVLALIPRPDVGTVVQWSIIFAGSGLGWGLYQWGTWRKGARPQSPPQA